MTAVGLATRDLKNDLIRRYGLSVEDAGHLRHRVMTTEGAEEYARSAATIPEVTLTAEEAVAIADRHGLSLTDASALQVLATDPTTAEKLAAQIAGSNQLTRADLASMSPDEIDKARKEGRLADLLSTETWGPGVPTHEEATRARQDPSLDPDRQLTREDLRKMPAERIAQAQREGRLQHLLDPDGKYTAASANPDQHTRRPANNTGHGTTVTTTPTTANAPHLPA